MMQGWCCRTAFFVAAMLGGTHSAGASDCVADVQALGGRIAGAARQATVKLAPRQALFRNVNRNGRCGD